MQTFCCCRLLFLWAERWGRVPLFCTMFLQAVLLLLITGLLADGASIPTPLHKPLHKRRFLTQQIYEEVVAQGARPQDTQVYIIKLKHHGHATYDGSLEGYQATGPQFTNQKLQMDSEHYQMYDSHLSAERDAAKIEIAKIIGHPVDILFEYTVAFHGMAGCPFCCLVYGTQLKSHESGCADM